MKRSIRSKIASCAFAGLMLLAGPAQAQRVIHIHGTQVTIDHNDNLPSRPTSVHAATAQRNSNLGSTATSLRSNASNDLDTSATARFVTHNGKTYQVDANGRLLGVYNGTSSAEALNATLTRNVRTSLMPDSGTSVSPGRGYNHAAALRAQQQQMAAQPQTPNLGVTAGGRNSARVMNTPDQNVLNNGVATGPMGQYFYPANTSGYLDSPLFPIPPNLTVGTPLPGQVSLPSAGSIFGPSSGSSVSSGFVGEPGAFYNGTYYYAPSYFNGGNFPITNTLAPNSAIPTGVTTTGLGSPAPTGPSAGAPAFGGTAPTSTATGLSGTPPANAINSNGNPVFNNGFAAPTATGTGLINGNAATGPTFAAPGGPYSR